MFPLLLECFVRVALIILRFLQHFKGKFESVYYCMLLHFRGLVYLCLRVYKLIFIYMPEGLRTWHRVNSAADRVKPSWRTAVGSSLSKDSPVLSLFRVRPWLLGWTLSIFLPTPGYFPWILRTTSTQGNHHGYLCVYLRICRVCPNGSILIRSLPFITYKCVYSFTQLRSL